MNCVLAQACLSKALKIASKAVTNKPSHPILACVQLSAGSDEDNPGSFSIEASDLSTSIHRNIEAEVKDVGRLCVPFRPLHDLISRLDSGQSLMLGSQGSDLCVTTQTGGTYKIAGYPGADWISMPVKEDALQIQANVVKACHTVSKAIAKDRPDINGINIRVIDGRLTFAATDGHRLHTYSHSIECSDPIPDGAVNVTVPEAALEIAESSKGEITFTSGAKVVEFRDGKDWVSARIYEKPYPDYPQLVPSDYRISVTVDRVKLLKLVETVGTVAADAENIMHLGKSTERKNNLVLNAMHTMGFAKDFIDAEFEYNYDPAADPTSDDFDCYLNSRFFAEALRSLEGDQVYINWLGRVQPLVLKSDDSEQLCLVMPIQGRAKDE